LGGVLGAGLIGAGYAAEALGKNVREMGGYMGAATFQVTALGTVFPSAVESAKGLSREFGGLKDVRKYQATDIRFTTKNGNVYVFVMEPPTADISIASLGKNAPFETKAVASVKLLGSSEKLNWNQGDNALVINKPATLPKWTTLVFKVAFKK
jgi:alpha-L-fucosidase